jgi:YegS/Rv2252/BmrU family lipid kinase
MATTFSTVVIANPSSAGGGLGKKWSGIASVIASNFGAFQHRFTQRPGDASRLTREVLQSGRFEMVVAMGGDGTIGEVVDGFFDEQGEPIAPDVAFGVLPYGTGGDFRRVIHAAKDLARGAAQLRGTETSQIDVGRLIYTDDEGNERTRHFANIASFGISAVVDRFVNEGSKKLGGRISFAIATVRAMRAYRPKRARLIVDDGPPEEVTLQTVAVANGQYFGGGMQIAPNAKLDDGQFDVVTMRPFAVKDLLLRGHLIYQGKHLSLTQYFSVARGRRVVAEPVDPGDHILLDVDGETPGRLPATFEVLPGALKLKTPRAI